MSDRNRYRTESVILTQGNSTFLNNTITYTAPRQIDLKDAEVAMNFLSIPYSWRNITTEFNNKNFAYVWNGTEFPIVIPDGFYSISDLDLYLKFVMNQNGHYLVDGDGDPVYYITFASNPIYYTTTFTLSVVPAILPVGFTNPNAITLNGLTPQIRFAVGAEFNTLLGVDAGTYPTAQSATLFDFNAQNTPLISPVSSINVSCNLAFNEIQINQVVYSFIPTASYGSYLSIEPQNIIYYHSPDGSYPEISITFADQVFRPLAIIDQDIEVQILIRTRKDIT